MSEQVRPSAWLIGGDATSDAARVNSFLTAMGASVHPHPESLAPPLYTEAAAYELAARKLEERADRYEARGLEGERGNSGMYAEGHRRAARYLRSLHTGEPRP